MRRVIHFELPADEPERAVKFYQDVFGWTINKWEGPLDYWLVMTGDQAAPGINGAISPRAQGATVTYVIDVPSVDECVEQVVAAGGTIALARHEVPGVGYLAYCSDTEGNLFGIMEEL